MTDESNQKPNQKLEYRAGKEELRPEGKADVGCALIFAVIAVLALAGIATIVGFSWKRRFVWAEIVAVVGLGLFAAGSIIAVCGRLTRHRWWGNKDWKEDWRR